MFVKFFSKLKAKPSNIVLNFISAKLNGRDGRSVSRKLVEFKSKASDISECIRCICYLIFLIIISIQLMSVVKKLITT